MAIGYVALGSNMGDRLSLLRTAAALLSRVEGTAVAARSSVYETDAVAEEPQPPYLNAAVRLETVLAPRVLLQSCLQVENQLGRTRPPGVPHAPRLIDLDLLLYDDRVIAEPGLVVPHPGLLARAFVLVPLADVALPGLRHPVAGTPLDRAPTAAPGVRLVARASLG